MPVCVATIEKKNVTLYTLYQYVHTCIYIYIYIYCVGSPQKKVRRCLVVHGEGVKISGGTLLGRQEEQKIASRSPNVQTAMFIPSYTDIYIVLGYTRDIKYSTIMSKVQRNENPPKGGVGFSAKHRRGWRLMHRMLSIGR